VIVADDALEGAGTAELAAVLAAAVRHIGDVDLVITGDSSVDVGTGLVPTVLAGHLGWPAVADVQAVTFAAEALRVVRMIAGVTQVLQISGPAVLAASTDAAAPRLPGMKDILSAAKKPVVVVTVADLDMPPAPGPVTLLGTARPNLKVRKGRMFDTNDPASAAAELVTALRGDGLLQ
jgi:electron transfer flavoprotein beta subunit